MFQDDAVLDVALFGSRHFVIRPGMSFSGRVMLVELLRFGKFMALA